MENVNTYSNTRDIRDRLDMAKLSARLSSETSLEDSIFKNLDRLEALCNARTALDSNDCILPKAAMHHYSSVVEDYTKELKKLLNQHFG